MHPSERRERIARFEALCRQRGLPLTVQRRVVLDAILDRDDHPTADGIYDEVRQQVPDISRTTVYRILDILVEFGIITKICHPGLAVRFDPKIQQHHHLVCTHCERIIDLDEERLDELTWPDVRRHGFEIRDYHIHFRGLCAACRRTLKKQAARTGRANRREAGKPGRAKKERSGRKRKPRQ